MSVPTWTEAEIQFLRDNYETRGTACFAELPHSALGCQKRVSILGLKQRKERPALQIIELSKRPEGVGTDDGDFRGSLFTYLVYDGRLFTTAKNQGKCKKRYFHTQEASDAYYSTVVAGKQTKPTGAVLRKAGSAGVPIPKQVTGGPARLPGEPDFSQAKWTYGKAPPERIYHTNTHSRFA